ncbi:MAG: hypothetical protein EOP56_01105 [Sphingobacteriales bacterium]|nr:MAG: hypothetical protein EOP56_01105 [Sphingobacteriales bacterium]
MKEQYRITIPKPCNEAWEDMQPADKGRHCLQCSKTVVDFSTMTDVEVLAFLQRHKGKFVCGRLSSV